ncbi:unnamed protein product [Lupinus luteus]|uniref:Uncharacterized protein n=1 Tax=Lupinus luteus TaxID=3873 RepID=A0AAV1YFQ2_LUPLU
MDRLDVGRIILAVAANNNKIDVTQKIWISDVLYSIRMIEDALRRYGSKEGGTESIGSVDGEWWSENNLDGRAESLEEEGDEE